ncbi:hypothetical protein CRUP_023031 [Coryphaenoides rupestris]|nr:hypothetical protein CRUP_023031 [Coryphaenoides rupestris]
MSSLKSSSLRMSGPMAVTSRRSASASTSLSSLRVRFLAWSLISSMRLLCASSVVSSAQSSSPVAGIRTTASGASMSWFLPASPFSLSFFLFFFSFSFFTVAEPPVSVASEEHRQLVTSPTLGTVLPVTYGPRPLTQLARGPPHPSLGSTKLNSLYGHGWCQSSAADAGSRVCRCGSQSGGSVRDSPGGFFRMKVQSLCLVSRLPRLQAGRLDGHHTGSTGCATALQDRGEGDSVRATETTTTPATH